MSLFRSIATVGSWTMGSRLLGFVRDILMVSALGTGMVADAFFVAFKFPNFFVAFFAEAPSTPPLSRCSGTARERRHNSGPHVLPPRRLL